MTTFSAMVQRNFPGCWVLEMQTRSLVMSWHCAGGPHLLLLPGYLDLSRAHLGRRPHHPDYQAQGGAPLQYTPMPVVRVGLPYDVRGPALERA